MDTRKFCAMAMVSIATVATIVVAGAQPVWAKTWTVKCEGIGCLDFKVKVPLCPVPIVNNYTNVLSPPAGDWSLGVSPVWTSVSGDGPTLRGGELQFIGDLRVVGNRILFHFQGGPGGAQVGNDQRFTISELAGFQFRYADWGSVTLGGRHRVAFKAAGDVANALLGEGQVRFGWFHFTLGLFGGVGGAWYQTSRPLEGTYPAGARVPVEQAPAGAKAAEAGALVEWRF